MISKVWVKAFNTVMPIAMWIDEYHFLTKDGQIGLLLSITGIDCECINDSIAETYTKRFREALKGFTDDYRVLQYIIKNDGAEIPVQERYVNELAGDAARVRKQFLESTSEGLYESGTYVCILFKPKKVMTAQDANGFSISLK